TSVPVDVGPACPDPTLVAEPAGVPGRTALDAPHLPPADSAGTSAVYGNDVPFPWAGDIPGKPPKPSLRRTSAPARSVVSGRSNARGGSVSQPAPVPASRRTPALRRRPLWRASRDAGPASSCGRGCPFRRLVASSGGREN